MEAGTTLHVPDPGSSYDSHLWIIVSDPIIDPTRVLMVSMTTWEEHKDQACVLDVGDHPYIRHRTCINYRQAKVVTLNQLFALKDAGKIKLMEPANAELLHRIREGVADSQMRLDHVQILEEQGLIEE